MVNIVRFFETRPVEEIGFVTITAPKEVRTAAELQRRFHSFMTGVLSEYVGHYVRVLEWHRSGRPHFHLLVWFPGRDIRTGFNWDFRAERKRIEASVPAGREREKARRAAARRYRVLSTNERLRELWRLVEGRRKAYGLGRTDIEPIRENAEAAGKYLAGYLTKGGRPPVDPQTGKPERARVVVYSEGFPKAHGLHYAWDTAKARIYRAKLKRFALLHNCFSEAQLAEKFGKHWAYTCRAAIMATPGEYREEGVLGSFTDKEGHVNEIWGTAVEEVYDQRPEVMPHHTDPRAAKVRRWAHELGLDRVWDPQASDWRGYEDVARERFGPEWAEKYREDIEAADVAGRRPDYRDRRTWRET